MKIICGLIKLVMNQFVMTDKYGTELIALIDMFYNLPDHKHYAENWDLNPRPIEKKQIFDSIATRIKIGRKGVLLRHLVIIDTDLYTYTAVQNCLQTNQLPLDITGFAADGNTGLDVIRRWNPDVVLMSMAAPGVDAAMFIQRFPDSRFILLTDHADFNNAVYAFRAGTSDILLKPIRNEQLLPSLERITYYSSAYSTAVNDVIELICHNYREKLTLEHISRVVYLSPCHIARVFKQQTGKTILNYHHYVRIMKAKELLSTGCNISDCAVQVGYSNINQFFKYFKRFTNSTPHSFQMKARFGNIYDQEIWP